MNRIWGEAAVTVEGASNGGSAAGLVAADGAAVCWEMGVA